MQEWADDATPWTPLTFDQYGVHAQLSIKTRQGLYYKAGRERLLKFVLVRDDLGKRPLSIFYSTLLDLDAREILSTYAGRWSIEVTIENGKQLLASRTPPTRLPKAVERTAPMAMILVSLTTLWFHQEGHRHVTFPYRPWYLRKKEPSLGDMLTTLRRLSWEELGRDVVPRQGPLKTQFAKLTEFLSRARLTTENRVFHSQIQLPPLCVSACPWREPGRITYNETAKLELSRRPACAMRPPGFEANYRPLLGARYRRRGSVSPQHELAQPCDPAAAARPLLERSALLSTPCFRSTAGVADSGGSLFRQCTPQGGAAVE